MNPSASPQRTLISSLATRARFSRRHAIAVGLAGSIAVPSLQARAQTSPPIEPRGGTDPVNDPDPSSDQVIEPEAEPTLPPDSDAGTVVQAAESANAQYFAETGHNLDEPFATIWTSAGGKEGPGLPLSEPYFLSDSGIVRQDFKGMAFTYRPDADAASSLQGVQLPDSVIESEVPSAKRSTTATTDAAFATHVAAHGGQQVFGTAVSSAYTKSGVTRQAFANAILEKTKAGKIAMLAANEKTSLAAHGNDEAFQPAPPTLGTTFFVKASDGLRVHASPSADGKVIAVVPDNAEFVAAPNSDGAWVPGYVDGVTGWVAREFLVSTNTLPRADSGSWDVTVWEGATLGDTNLRKSPAASGQSVRIIPQGEPVKVVEWVEGEAVVEYQTVWAKLDNGSYVYSRNIGRAAPVAPPPLPNDAPSEGKWLDVHLTQQLMTAYEGRKAVRTIVISTGQPKWETPEGWFAINTRVANETMESGSIGADHFYVLKNVLFTQYFTDRGHALHYAWWKNEETIGRPGSHGCINLLLDDAQFCWDWAEIGTQVICRKT